MMATFLAAIIVLVASGMAALFAWQSERAATLLGAGGALLGCLTGLAAAIQSLVRGGESFRVAWEVPYGSFYLTLDPLSGFFLLPLFGLSALGAMYGAEYLQRYQGKKRLGPPWFFYNLLVVGMAIVLTARNAVLFLVAWEVMTLASFFLVTLDNEREEVREAGWTYLVATHLGTAFLLALFVLLGGGNDSLDFDRFGRPSHAGALFLLAVVGFGTKAGFMPLHVWLPEAHPAAPSHVSALMSGVMIKTGIYGLIRMITILGHPAPWWGWMLVAIGITSGVLGVLFALAQHDLKRLLAYHSVENIGIISLGLGIGVLGQSYGLPQLVAFGYAGALLHVVNHGIFKGLLFLGAGGVFHATGTRDIERLGGLFKKMPMTGLTFLVGAAAICGLPPLNGFVSEFLVFLGSYRAVISLGARGAAPAVAAILGLALIGGLAAACFTKAFGIAFLGEPRSSAVAPAHEPGFAMRIPMIVLAAACLAVGLLSPWIVGSMGSLIGFVLPMESLAPLKAFVIAATAMLAAIVLLTILRRRLLRGRQIASSVTWDCGYAAPSPRMQYTAASFAQPLTDLFGVILRTRRHCAPPAGLFPSGGSLETETPDAARETLFRPAFTSVAWALSKLRWLQTGNAHLYVLYIALTLVALLGWKLV
jgi:formate hydrogenlyase subunit 3/multisubunit Na+/H+ antiporter MnhD subunit